MVPKSTVQRFDVGMAGREACTVTRDEKLFQVLKLVPLIPTILPQVPREESESQEPIRVVVIPSPTLTTMSLALKTAGLLQFTTSFLKGSSYISSAVTAAGRRAATRPAGLSGASTNVLHVKQNIH